MDILSKYKRTVFYMKDHFSSHAFASTSLKSLRLLDLLTFDYLWSLSLLGFTGPYWASLGLTWPYWALLGLTRPFSAIYCICRLTDLLTY